MMNTHRFAPMAGPSAAPTTAPPGACRRPELPARYAQGAEVPSPCVSVCKMDPATGWCEGCLRTLDEIAAWSALGAAARRAVWAELPARFDARAAERREPRP